MRLEVHGRAHETAVGAFLATIAVFDVISGPVHSLTLRSLQGLQFRSGNQFEGPGGTKKDTLGCLGPDAQAEVAFQGPVRIRIPENGLPGAGGPAENALIKGQPFDHDHFLGHAFMGTADRRPGQDRKEPVVLPLNPDPGSPRVDLVLLMGKAAGDFAMPASRTSVMVDDDDVFFQIEFRYLRPQGSVH
jgi:hypothetical protein